MNTPKTPNAPPTRAVRPANFLRNVIERDLEAAPTRSGPGAATPETPRTTPAARPIPARVRLVSARTQRLPAHRPRQVDLPELRPGARLRRRVPPALRRHQPEKEEQEYVDGIEANVRWLGFDWNTPAGSNLYFASNYFDFMYRAAEALVQDGLAYVDEQTPDEMRANRGDFGTPGKDSPFRDRTPDENLARLREMRDGAPRRRDGAAREDRHGEPEHQPARPGALPHPAARTTTTPATSGASIRCTPSRIRSRTRWSASRTASARSSSKTSARSTTGCSSTSPASACWPIRCPGSTNSRA